MCKWEDNIQTDRLLKCVNAWTDWINLASVQWWDTVNTVIHLRVP